MQATVASFSPTSRDGTVLLDNGTELPFTAPVFDASGLRLLRPGQRVVLRCEGGGVTAMNHVTLPLP